MLWLVESVAVFNLGIQNVMKEHVELAQAPGGTVLFLTIESQFSRTAIFAFDIVERFNQHTARANSGIADFGILRRVENVHQQLDNGARRIEFAPLFPCAVGNVFDQLFIGRTKQIRKFEIVIGEHHLVEMADELNHFGIGNPLVIFAEGFIEVDRFQNAFKAAKILLFQLGKGFHQLRAQPPAFDA